MPDEAILRLWAGNLRFAAGQSTSDQSMERRIAVAPGQHPFATIFSCVDSRVSPELIFDQGLGDLFVIRTAGQVLDRAVLGSLEFCVVEMGIRVLVVLGHEHCGAVKAAMDALETEEAAPAEIEYLVEGLAQAVEQGRQAGGDVWNDAGRAQVQLVVARLQTVPIMQRAIEAGQLAIVGAWYDLETGRVELITHPRGLGLAVLGKTASPPDVN